MFNVDQLRLDIEALLLDFPDLAEDEMLRADMLDGETNLHEVLTALFQSVDNDKLMADAVAARIAELNTRRARFKRRIEFGRSLILKVLQSADLRKVELPEATLSQRASAPQLIGEPIGELPADLVRVSVEPDRVKIREALLADREVPGFVLSNSPPTLSISVK